MYIEYSQKKYSISINEKTTMFDQEESAVTPQ